jgi:hypothetical protein
MARAVARAFWNLPRFHHLGQIWRQPGARQGPPPVKLCRAATASRFFRGLQECHGPGVNAANPTLPDRPGRRSGKGKRKSDGRAKGFTWGAQKPTRPPLTVSFRWSAVRTQYRPQHPTPRGGGEGAHASKFVSVCRERPLFSGGAKIISMITSFGTFFRKNLHAPCIS